MEYLFEDSKMQIFGEDLADVISLMFDLPDRLFKEMESLSSSERWNSANTSVHQVMSVLNNVVRLHEIWQDINQVRGTKILN